MGDFCLLLGVTDQLSVLSSESRFRILLGLLLPSFYYLTFFLTCFWLASAIFLRFYSPALGTDEITVMRKARAKAQDGRPAYATGRLWGGG